MEHWIYTITIAGHSLSLNLDTIFTMWFAMLCLIIFAFIATRNLDIVPGKLQAFCEKIMSFFWGIMDTMMPGKNKQHVPLVASLFLFILFANLMGQLPLRIIHIKEGELASPTNDINMTAGMAILVLIYYVYQGIRAKGIRYFLRSFNPIDIVEAIVELAEMVIRPFTLALRLFANILAGELLVAAFVGIFAYLLPLPIMLFEVFVAFVQALVFTMLATAYVALATAEDEH